MPASPDLARSFGAAADEYDRVRPDWPAEAVDLAGSRLGLGRDAVVVDVAAGTGKLTRRLAARFDRVIAVEPDDRMRERIGGEALAGTAERLPLPDESADCVFTGDAFHWFDGPAALREFARVLRPGGGVVVLWNMWWEIEPPIPEAAVELLRVPYERSGRAVAAAFAEDRWQAAFAGSAFPPPQDDHVEWALPISRADLVALYATTSSIATLPDDERAGLRAGLLHVLDVSYSLQIKTQVHWTRAG